jgi:hypothetical protein
MFRRLFLFIIPAVIVLVSCKHPNKSEPFPDKWYNLERDTSGYVFYSPCEGDTPYILFRKDSVIIQWQLETEESKIIRRQEVNGHYKIKSRSAAFDINFDIRWLNATHTLALWKFNIASHDSSFKVDHKWVMCPATVKSKYKVVTCVNPHPTYKADEMRFLPIDIN